MIARINTGAKPAGAVYYNEDKVAQGKARYLGGFNAVPFDRDQINLTTKINVLDMYVQGNHRVSKPTFHTSLAFHPSEQLSDQKLTEIGQQYMERLGYGKQPYLIYRHEDTNHPHIHIVSVSVDAEGKRISDSYQHRRSNAIRKELEKEFGLMEAEKQGQPMLMDGRLPEQVLTYKEPEAKRAISNVVQTAMKDYRFSGIDTFSAFLHQHGVQLNQRSGVGADGKPYRGITFQLSVGETGKRGQPIGPAIKASRFAFVPTMDRLEQQFKRGGQQSQAGQQTTRKRIERALTNYDAVSQDDFKAELQGEGVQLLDTGVRFIYVDHKSRNVYDEEELGELFRRERWQNVFAKQSKLRQQPVVQVVKPMTATTSNKPNARVNKSTSAEPKATIPVRGQLPGDKEPKRPLKPAPIPPATSPVSAPVALTAEKEKVLIEAVSKAYQKLRTEGIPDATPGTLCPVYFESQLIARFPYQLLTDTLVAQGVPGHDARKAVAKFETYKQSQLPDIRAKEQSYFDQTTALLLKLVQRMPVNAASRQAFLKSMELDLVGFNIRHRQNDALYFPLTKSQQDELRGKQGVAVPFPDKANELMRSLYLSIAAQQPVPTGVSYYQIKVYHLRRTIDQQSFNQVAPSLNINYLAQVSQHLVNEKPMLMQLASRGIVVEKGGDNRYRAGHTLSEPDSFVTLDKSLSARLSQEYLPELAIQRQVQQTVSIRSLVRLSQAIDVQDEGRIQRVSQDALNHLTERFGIVDTKTVHQRLQKDLETLYGPKPSAATGPSLPHAAEVAVVTPVKTAPPLHRLEQSAYGQAVIAMLLKIELSPAERGLLASQLGLQWQVGPHGRLRVIEKAAQPTFATPCPGAIYPLDEQATALFEPTRPASNPNELPAGRKSSKNVYIPNEEDWLVLVHQLVGRPMQELTLNNYQVARLQIRGIQLLTEASQQGSLQSWYNRARGQQIIDQGPAQHEQDFSARRYLTDFYQRGFIVSRTVTSGNQTTGGKPQYSMGLTDTPVATHAVLPDWLSQRMEHLNVSMKQEKEIGSTMLIEGGWPGFMSKQSQRMQWLARVLDSKQPAGIAAATKLIQQEYPALREVTNSSMLLDALASQPTARLQQTQPLTVGAVGRYELETALDSVSSQRVAQLKQSFASLGLLRVIEKTARPAPVVGQTVSGRNWKPR